MTFESLGLMTEVCQAVFEKGYSTPTPIQRKAIPIILQGRDVLGGAQTGTGKTAGFTLPLLQRLIQSTVDRKRKLAVRALVLAPTRELAAQLAECVTDYSRYLPIRSTVIFGGTNIRPQAKVLQQGVDVLVATPGRLLDHVRQQSVDLSQVEYFVLDEADRMLDMGFIHDIRKIIALLPVKKQVLLFSATFPSQIEQLMKNLLKNPERIEVASKNSHSELVSHVVHPVDKLKKRELLTHLIHSNQWNQVLVFTRTKHGADRLSKQLNSEQIESAAIHGNKSQGARTKALKDFKSGKTRVLVATDIAARGLDIEQLPHVVNYELPNVAEDYVHRIGRTGRAGCTGEAISLVSTDESKLLGAIERLIQKKVPRITVTGFHAEVSTESAVEHRNTAPNRSGAKGKIRTASNKHNQGKVKRFKGRKQVNKKARSPERVSAF